VTAAEPRSAPTCPFNPRERDTLRQPLTPLTGSDVLNSTLLITIGYFHQITRAELRTILGHDVGRESSPACGIPA